MSAECLFLSRDARLHIKPTSKMLRWWILAGLLLTCLTPRHTSATIWDTALRRFHQLLNNPEGLTFDVPTSLLRPQYDFVVIGAGTAGATVTSRLTEVPKWNVLLLEAGGDELAVTEVPVMAPVLARTHFNWGYTAVPQSNACLAYLRGACACQKGKGMGGGSATNYMVYTRGHPGDYDGWEGMGNQGWGWRDVLPYFLKSENMQDSELQRSPLHSSGGYLDIQQVAYSSGIGKALLRGAQEAGYPLTDYNSGQLIGFSPLQVTQRRGRRCSSSKAFLRPVRNRLNLHVAKHAHATKILINPATKRAYGVEFQRGGRRWYVKVKKEVILAAGAINTPQLLMLSGVGPRDHLKELNISVIQDSPGVGQNMQDHLSFFTQMVVNDSSVVVSAQETALNLKSYTDYVKYGKGPFTLAGGAEGIGFFRSPISRTPPDHPDLELILAPGNLAAGEPEIVRRIVSMGSETYNTVYKPLQRAHAFTLTAVLLLPESRGWVRLRDSSPFTPPLIYNNYLENEHDLDTFVQGLRFIESLTQTPSLRQLDTRLHDIPIPGCRQHQFGSDLYHKCAVQHVAMSLGHHSGTAKMGPPSDPMAVVDPELRVYGVKGLRVVDASIMPRIITGHTNGPVFMIAEKASDLIKSSYGKY